MECNILTHASRIVRYLLSGVLNILHSHEFLSSFPLYFKFPHKAIPPIHVFHIYCSIMVINIYQNTQLVLYASVQPLGQSAFMFLNNLIKDTRCFVHTGFQRQRSLLWTNQITLQQLLTFAYIPPMFLESYVSYFTHGQYISGIYNYPFKNL